jgi:ATP-dependent RNA helicase RhlE
MRFEDLQLNKYLFRALEDLGFEEPTPIQVEAFSPVLSGKDIVGIAQTGTGKTFAYLLPLLRDMKYSTEVPPKILILVPTRELVLQVVEQTESLIKYMNVRVLGIYGGANINKQKLAVAQGTDILVATPGRLYDLIISTAVSLKSVKKLVIDEVDIMLDLGFRFQLSNIFEHVNPRRQSLMFSATMTEEVEALIDDFFVSPVKISIALSGEPLENIEQSAYPVKNFYTKANLLAHLLSDTALYSKVLVFVDSKKNADRLFDVLEELFPSKIGIIHSNKSQNFRIRSVNEFDKGKKRILVATDLIARGLDFEQISHVVSFDVPKYPENYIHRIGRTGRAELAGRSLLFYTPAEVEYKEAIESLMDYRIPSLDFPMEVEVSDQLIPDERPKVPGKDPGRNFKRTESGPAFHEKKEKNKKTNQGGSYLRKKKAYKKPQTRGDKNFNRRNKKK